MFVGVFSCIMWFHCWKRFNMLSHYISVLCWCFIMRLMFSSLIFNRTYVLSIFLSQSRLNCLASYSQSSYEKCFGFFSSKLFFILFAVSTVNGTLLSVCSGSWEHSMQYSDMCILSITYILKIIRHHIYERVLIYYEINVNTCCNIIQDN